MAGLAALALTLTAFLLANLDLNQAQSSKPEFYVDFCNTGNYQSRDFWKLPATRGSTYPRDGFCQALSSRDDGQPGTYDVSAELFSQRDCGMECGHAGIIYNADGQLNFDLVMFRTYDGASCYEYGYVENGKYTMVGEGPCRAGNPKPQTWFKVKLDVQSDDSAVLRLDENYVAQVRPKFRARRLGGVLTKNGFDDLILYRSYRLTRPRQGEERPTVADPCRENPCKNRGRCSSAYDATSGEYKVTCRCDRDHMGKFCEKEVPCRRNPCRAGGRCTDTCSEAVCSCPKERTGQFCQFRKCNVDYEECDRQHNVEELQRADYKNFKTCRKSALRVLFKWRRCMAKKNREFQQRRNCDCRGADVALAKRYRFFGSTATARAATACFMTDKYRRSLQRGEKCSAATQSCAESLIEIAKGDPLAEVDDKERCRGPMREQQETCIKDFLSRKLDLSGCPMYTQFFRTYAPALETWLMTLCTDCPHRMIMRECFGNVTGLYQEFGAVQFCRSWMAIDQTRACVERKLRDSPKCSDSADIVLRHVDYTKQFFKNMWQVPCEAAIRYSEIRTRQWSCPADDVEADVTSITLPNGGAGNLYSSQIGLALKNTVRQGRNILCKSDLES